MSTAIALQNLPRPQHETNGIRHRTIPSAASNDTQTFQEHDPGLETLHDVDVSTVPIEPPSFKPTSIYWITPHGMLARSITVLDLTKDMDVPYTGMTTEYKAHVRKTLKDHSFTPILTCTRTSWVGLKYDVTNGQDEHIAHWSHAWTSFGSARLDFPALSAHCPHDLELRPHRLGMRTETFTLNSHPYLWEPNSFWHSSDLTLYKVFGSGQAEKRVPIGKFAQKCWSGFITGGTVVVDEKQINGVIALLTLIVVLKKKRQRAAERRGAGE